ncbi:MAG: ribonuclease H-like domain-containing protein [Christensenellaceae bacterium]|jgi:uncharacterized protein YprB with RNaseH-like and TPR domain|nr:ribonuclease H-like domain-containing protein [Christensenellaceae bacterium]
MSFLRDRLKQLAQSAPAEPQPESRPRPRCAIRRVSLALGEIGLSREGLFFLGGDEAARAFACEEGLAFIDVESTGLSRGAGTTAFEIGIGRIRGGKMELTQLYMRDYDEEEDLLRSAAECLKGAELLVSFNGKSFDLPMLRARMVMNRLPPGFTGLPHLDLLHGARRLYKLRLKQCNLGRLEEIILGAPRQDDIPGALIPGIWAAFLKNGDLEPILRVLEHNERDVFSMALLLRELLKAQADPTAQRHAEDIYSAGLALERAGRPREAERCYAFTLSGGTRLLSGLALSRLYRRQGRLDENIAHLQALSDGQGGENFARVELAKIYEHKKRDYAQALRLTEEAMALGLPGAEMEALRARRKRLLRRLNKGG